jgi:hypothetical protein
LPEPNQHPEESYVYRRIPASYLRGKPPKPKPAAFKVKAGGSLSVFLATRQSPRGVLQHGIEAAKQMAASADEAIRSRGEKQLSDYGSTVEEWVQNGCRVARLAIPEFTRRGFVVSEPEDDGHINVSGDHEAYMDELAEAAELLTPEQCCE